MWSVVLGVLALLLVSAAAFARPPADPAPQPGAVIGGRAVVVYTPAYRVSFFGVERLHPFDIAKYDRIARHLRREGLVGRGDFAIPAPVSDAALSAVHDAGYLASLTDAASLSRALEVAVPGFFGAGVIERRVLAAFRRAVGGTRLAAEAALEHGVGINLGGGFHHARPDMGHGFCIYNDVAYAVHSLREDGFAGRVLIVDTDAHQGDGSHAFFADDPEVFSFSMHQGDIFPVPKLHGDRDLPLRGGTDDATFLAALDEALSAILQAERFDLVFHVAGSDVLADDPLAGLAMTPEGLVQRDLLVTRKVRSQGIPLVHLLAGGYGPSSAEAQGRAVAAILRSAQDAEEGVD